MFTSLLKTNSSNPFTDFLLWKNDQKQKDLSTYYLEFSTDLSYSYNWRLCCQTKNPLNVLKLVCEYTAIFVGEWYY